MSNLTKDQLRFTKWLENPLLQRFAHCWDFERREISFLSVKLTLAGLSHGEKEMLKFLSCVWLQEDRFGFDFIAASQVLDDEQRQIISNWFADPFWP